MTLEQNFLTIAADKLAENLERIDAMSMSDGSARRGVKRWPWGHCYLLFVFLRSAQYFFIRALTARF